MILAALLVPVFQQARAQARKTSCLNQMRQFGQTITTYRGDNTDSMPLWLSSLYPDYVPSEKLYVCPQDDTNGYDGGRHGLGFESDDLPAGKQDNDKPGSKYVNFANGDNDMLPDPSLPGLLLKDTFSETDDTFRNDKNRTGQTDPLYFGANPEITHSSYMYEFANVACSWLDGVKDENGNQFTWYKAKPLQMRYGLGRNGAADFAVVDGKFTTDNQQDETPQ